MGKDPTRPLMKGRDNKTIYFILNHTTIGTVVSPELRKTITYNTNKTRRTTHDYSAGPVEFMYVN